MAEDGKKICVQDSRRWWALHRREETHSCPLYWNLTLWEAKVKPAETSTHFQQRRVGWQHRLEFWETQLLRVFTDPLTLPQKSSWVLYWDMPHMWGMWELYPNSRELSFEGGFGARQETWEWFIRSTLDNFQLLRLHLGKLCREKLMWGILDRESSPRVLKIWIRTGEKRELSRNPKTGNRLGSRERFLTVGKAGDSTINYRDARCLSCAHNSNPIGRKNTILFPKLFFEPEVN